MHSKLARVASVFVIALACQSQAAAPASLLKADQAKGVQNERIQDRSPAAARSITRNHAPAPSLANIDIKTLKKITPKPPIKRNVQANARFSVPTACGHLEKACTTAGFDSGDIKPGHKTLPQCMTELLAGRQVASVNVSDTDIKSCRLGLQVQTRQ